jgi:hypothetical protein
LTACHPGRVGGGGGGFYLTLTPINTVCECILVPVPQRTKKLRYKKNAVDTVVLQNNVCCNKTSSCYLKSCPNRTTCELCGLRGRFNARSSIVTCLHVLNAFGRATRAKGCLGLASANAALNLQRLTALLCGPNGPLNSLARFFCWREASRKCSVNKSCLYDTSMLVSMIYLWATTRGLSLLVTTSLSEQIKRRQYSSRLFMLVVNQPRVSRTGFGDPRRFNPGRANYFQGQETVRLNPFKRTSGTFWGSVNDPADH